MTDEQPRAALWLAVPALLWLAMLVRSAQVSLAASGRGALDVIETAIGLPAVVSAALVAGASVGLAVLWLLRHRLRERPSVRFGVGLAVGLLVGAGAAAGVVVGHLGDGSAITVLGAAIAASATIGGALAGSRAARVVGAGVAASLGVFLITFARELFNDELLHLFGAGDTPASLLAAQRRLGWAAGLLGGLSAGLIAYFHLRRSARNAPVPPRAAAYLVAGAGAGLMLLLTEVITRVGGAQVLSAARSVSAGDELFQQLAQEARVNSALIVLFVGALTAMIAYGRSLGARPERDAEPDAEHSDDQRSGDQRSGDQSGGRQGSDGQDDEGQGSHGQGQDSDSRDGDGQNMVSSSEASYHSSS